MAFEIGDTVFLNKRELIGWEIGDPANMRQQNVRISFLIKNTPYTICEIDGDSVKLKYNSPVSYHEGHFKKAELTDGQIQSVNIFKTGDKIKLVNRGLIGWEINDYSVTDGYIENIEYTVCKFYFNSGHPFLITNKTYAPIHSNHFKKV